MNNDEINRKITEHQKWRQCHFDHIDSPRTYINPYQPFYLSNTKIDEKTIFEDKNLRRAEFSDCDLRGVSFRRSNLTETIFNCCDLTKCNFDGAELARIKLINCKRDNSVYELAKRQTLNDITGFSSLLLCGISTFSLFFFTAILPAGWGFIAVLGVYGLCVGISYSMRNFWYNIFYRGKQ